MSLQAVIFDFDGLVIDTESPAYAAWSAIYAEHGVALDLRLWGTCVGAGEAVFDPVTHLGSLLGRDMGAGDRRRLMADKEQRKAAICQALMPLPGVRERLAEARRLGLATAVASSSSRAWVQGHLERLGLVQEFTAICTRDDVARVKPFPDLPLAAAARLGVEAAACLVLEDSLNGVKAAKAAGARCYAIPNQVTAHQDLGLADGVFASLLDVRFGR